MGTVCAWTGIERRRCVPGAGGLWGKVMHPGQPCQTPGTAGFPWRDGHSGQPMCGQWQARGALEAGEEVNQGPGANRPSSKHTRGEALQDERVPRTLMLGSARSGAGAGTCRTCWAVSVMPADVAGGFKALEAELQAVCGFVAVTQWGVISESLQECWE